MAMFKNIHLLATTLLAGGVSASAISTVIPTMTPVLQPLELINGPVSLLTRILCTVGPC